MEVYNGDISFKFLGFDDDREHRLYQCPFDGDVIPVQVDTFYGYCPTCNLTYIDYKPRPHQEAFHQSTARLRLNVGGYGSGKTTQSCAEVAEHILTVPKGRTILVAPTLGQLKNTVIKELGKFIDLSKKGKFISYARLSDPMEWLFTNGHHLLVMASNNDEVLRSLSVTCFYMEEASGIDVSIYNQLRARLRGSAGIRIDDETGEVVEDRLLGIICSNPEEGWLVDDLLIYSKNIYITPNVIRKPLVELHREPTKLVESFLTSTRDNLKHLPPDYLNLLCMGQTKEWIAKYIDCDISSKEDIIYPNWAEHVVENPFPIPDSWVVIGGYDSGLGDPTAMIAGAIDPEEGIIYLYDEYKVANETLSYHAKEMDKMFKGKKLFMPIQADPNMFNKTVRTGASDADYLRDRAKTPFEPATNKINYGITKAQDYLKLGKIKIFPHLVEFRKEIKDYITVKKGGKNVPIDVNNHLMDAFRYMIAPLPDNPNQFNSTYINEHVKSLVFYLNSGPEDFNEDRNRSVFHGNSSVSNKTSVRNTIKGGNVYGYNGEW